MQLNYNTFGAGFPLVILHGLLGSSDNWQSLAKQFSERFQVFTVDLRNHGASPHSPQFDYPSMAGDIQEFLDSHRLSEVHLLGHSMGGKVAMLFAASNPGRVRKLVIADIAPKAYPPHHTHLLDALWKLDLPSFPDRTSMDRALAADIPEAPLRAFFLKSVTRDAGGKFTWKINLKTIREQYSNIIEKPALPNPFPNPTLFIRGTQSDYILPEDEPEIRKDFPAAQFVSLEDAGHWLHAEKPHEFLQAAMDFLG